MTSPEGFETSYTLIERALNTDDEAAWNEVFDRYKKFIYYLLTKMNVTVEEMDDVVQIIMSELAQKLKTYDLKKGKFRSWFASMIRHKAIQEFRKKSNYNRKLGDYQSSLAVFEAGEDSNEVEDRIQHEWERYITDLAFERVTQSYTGVAVDVFKRGVRGESVEETAKSMDISVNTVYSYRMRVKQSLRLEVKQILDDLEGPSQ